MAGASKKSKEQSTVTGRVATSVPGFALVEVGARRRGKTPPEHTAAVLIPKLARALSKPGLSREVVFNGRTKNVYSYSVDPTDISRVVRVDPAGKRQVGRLVNGKFVSVKVA